MKKAVIDIGSNTIRSVIYQNDSLVIKPVLNQRDFVGIIQYISQGNLTKGGMNVLINTLKNHHKFCSVAGCPTPLCFATASLRTIQNREEVLACIQKEIGLYVDILTGEQEAYYDFLSLSSQKSDKNAMGLDLGGGSCQIFSYQNNQLKHSSSLPIGCLFLYQTFVSGLFPTKGEQKNICDYIKKQLSSLSPFHAPSPICYAMGGSARALCKLNRALLRQKVPINHYPLTKTDLQHLIDITTNKPQDIYHIMSQTIPERVHTILPAMLTLREILTWQNFSKLIVRKAGVREGYLIYHL